MIEKTIYDYLKTKLNVPVFMEYPKEETTEFVLLEKTGESNESLLFESRIAIQSYSDSLYKTAQLNESVIDAMLECISIDNISKCQLNASYNYPDTQRKKYRYQAVFDIIFLR